MQVPLSPLNECLPERPGEPDCLYFMRTQKCKFGNTCRFNHPKDNFNAETADASTFPERPHEPICSYYAKTGNCMFGVHCIYNHPKDLQIPGFSVSPASMHNTKGLPIRPEEPDCPFYLRTGSCKYGATCRYSHPEWNGQTIYQPLGNMNLSASFIPNTDPGLPQADQGSSIYPQRPGKTVCHFYMKTGQCKFAVTCKFHHPPNWTAPKEDVELTAAGLPRREGSIMCPFYKKNNHCMYGATCRYDHPPVEEVTVTLAGEGAAATEVNA
ncbi:hypothetical protein ZOSMA_196G00260 [Zostera marina]|uniref:C3H1-type domain-containing protein n=1 Tax=Zostera marina TaxID=29655 RepID=A0A0K9PR44_ZOSMR|nr:hypothetical protein ZOSMA_196G00260 [Zostera marina]